MRLAKNCLGTSQLRAWSTMFRIGTMNQLLIRQHWMIKPTRSRQPAKPVTMQNASPVVDVAVDVAVVVATMCAAVNALKAIDQLESVLATKRLWMTTTSNHGNQK